MYPVEFAFERIDYPSPEVVDLLDGDFLAKKIVEEWRVSSDFLLEKLAEEIKVKYNLSELHYFNSDGIADFNRKLATTQEEEQ